MILKTRCEVSSASRLKALSPFLDEKNLLRARGRLTKASLLMITRHPIILDGYNAAVKLLVLHTHEINCHCCREQTLNTLMEYYWIHRCRAVVKQTIRHCLPFRRKMQDVSTPQVVELHAERLPKKIGLSLKQLVSILTDLFLLKTMAGYLDDIFCSSPVLLLEQYILKSRMVSHRFYNQLIRRFISRRRKPNKVVPSCGKSFVGSNNALKSSIAELRESKMFDAKLHLMNVEIRWKFNPPAAPHSLEFGRDWYKL